MLPESPKENHTNPNERKTDSEKSRKSQKKRGIRLRKTISAIISNACGSRRKDEEEANTCTIVQPKENMGKILEELERELRESILINETRKVDNKNCKKLSLSRTFKKRIGFGIRRMKTITGGYPTTVKGSENSSVNIKDSYGSMTADKLPLKEEVKQMEKEEVQEESSNEEMELCKKRILMGEKCKPLNSSGVLHYDKDGIFVPEDVSSKVNNCI